MTTIKAVIFDLFGVLIHSNQYHNSNRNLLEIKLGLPETHLAKVAFCTSKFHDALCGTISEADLWRCVAEDVHLLPEEWQELQELFFSDYYFDEDLADLIRKLKPSYKLAILSNAFSDARKMIEQKYGLVSLVDEVVISAEEGMLKPDVRLFKNLAHRLDVHFQQLLVIDDSEDNIGVARFLGMQTVHFKDTSQALQECLQYLC